MLILIVSFIYYINFHFKEFLDYIWDFAMIDLKKKLDRKFRKLAKNHTSFISAEDLCMILGDSNNEKLSAIVYKVEESYQ